MRCGAPVQPWMDGWMDLLNHPMYTQHTICAYNAPHPPPSITTTNKNNSAAATSTNKNNNTASTTSSTTANTTTATSSTSTTTTTTTNNNNSLHPIAITVLTDIGLYFLECTAAGLLVSYWSVSPSSGGRHEAVVRARRRAAELKGSALTQRLTPCSSVRLRKRLRAAKAEGCSG